MGIYLIKAVPLTLTLVFSCIGIAAALITRSAEITGESDETTKKEMIRRAVLGTIPPSLCLAAFSFDIWVLTTLFSADDNTLLTYNLKDKNNTVPLLLVIHFFLYVAVLAWGGVVRGAPDYSQKPSYTWEILLALLAVSFCIGFQVYPP